MTKTNDDPIYDIRVAIADALRALKVHGSHKRLIDLAVDYLPDFFRQPLQGVEDAERVEDGKVKVTIPILIARNGEIQSGIYYRTDDGETTISKDGAIDSFSEEAYSQGWVTVNLNAEIDIEGIFERLEIYVPVEETE